jgi:HSP20 family protein
MSKKERPLKSGKSRGRYGRKIEVTEVDEKEAAAWLPNQVTRVDESGENVNQPENNWTTSMKPWRMGEKPSDIQLTREAFADLVDMEDEYRVLVEAPGIPKDKLNITVSKKRIEIDGETNIDQKKESKEQGYIFRGRRYTNIYKRLTFPDEVIPDKATATLESGLLDVRVPKKAPTPKSDVIR